MTSVVLKATRILGRNFRPVIQQNPGRSYSSALFISGSRANETFALFAPHLDFDERFADMEKLRRELRERGNVEIDADELAKSWRLYRNLEGKKLLLEEQRLEVARAMKELGKKGEGADEMEREKSRLMTRGKILKQDLRILKEALWQLEENVVVKALKLPNEIHESTPRGNSQILSSVGKILEPREPEIRSHVEIGAELGLIDYKNPINCYLCDAAAIFEVGTLRHVAEYLSAHGIARIAGTDFSRSLVVEGAGIDHEDPRKVFLLLNNEGWDLQKNCNRLHLVGGASMISFLAMHTKQLINPKDLPSKYFATGRKYVPFDERIQENGLFTVCQSSAAEIFALVKDSQGSEYLEEFERISRIVSELYNGLDIHYRVVARSAQELNPWESLRVSFEMWSANSRRYVEIGHLSMCGSFLSKRLLIAYQTPNGRDFPAIISGTVLSVQRLLACLLEEDSKKLRIPERIAEHMAGFGDRQDS